MSRRRWLTQMVLKSLHFRRGRSLLLIGVLALASSLVTSLGVVSITIGKRVEQEVRQYGANLVILPDSLSLDTGIGGLSFGKVAEPGYLDLKETEEAVSRGGSRVVGHSIHLRGVLGAGKRQVEAEGVDFTQIRRLFPWWQVKGGWPQQGEAMVGADLARELSLKRGDLLDLSAPAAPLQVRISGVVSTGGEEDRLLFVDLGKLQGALGAEGKLTSVRVLAGASGAALTRVAGEIRAALPKARVQEVRQLATSSDSLLRKVQLLMLLVTGVVLVTSGGSVAGTMSSTVLERGKEIGLLKAMGGTRREVLLIFGAEAVSLGLLGGVAGYLLGNGIAFTVTRTVFAAGCDFLPLLLPVALAVSLLLALMGSLGAMLSAYRLDPVRSLRGE